MKVTQTSPFIEKWAIGAVEEKPQPDTVTANLPANTSDNVMLIVPHRDETSLMIDYHDDAAPGPTPLTRNAPNELGPCP